MQSTVVPARRRRHSGSLENSAHASILARTALKGLISHIDPPPRPKSSPGERPAQRRRQKSPVESEDEQITNTGAANASDGEDGMKVEETGSGHVDEVPSSIDHEDPAKSDFLNNTNSNFSSTPSSTTIATPVPIASANISLEIPVTERPTRPLPTSKRKMAAGSTPNSHNPVAPVANPSMLPVQAQVARGGAAATQRRLYVILEQACLESYRISGSGSKGRNGKEGDVKYTLLNCDDHQGILAKTGRDIADARPDITHQVCFSSFVPDFLGVDADLGVVFTYAFGLATEQGWVASSLYPYREGRFDRG